MPRRASTTKEDMVEAAFELVRRDGLEALTARSLAAQLGCSTQPIMYRFPDLSVLRELVYQRADAFHSEYLFRASDLLDMGLRYVRFASEERPLFRLLFQSGHFDGASITEIIAAPEAAAVLQAAAGEFGLSGDAIASVFEALYVAVHGYASLVANNAMTYDPVAVERTLMAIAQGLQGSEEDHD